MAGSLCTHQGRLWPRNAQHCTAFSNNRKLGKFGSSEVPAKWPSAVLATSLTWAQSKQSKQSPQARRPRFQDGSGERRPRLVHRGVQQSREQPQPGKSSSATCPPIGSNSFLRAPFHSANDCITPIHTIPQSSQALRGHRTRSAVKCSRSGVGSWGVPRCSQCCGELLKESEGCSVVLLFVGLLH